MRLCKEVFDWETEIENSSTEVGGLELSVSSPMPSIHLSQYIVRLLANARTLAQIFISD